MVLTASPSGAPSDVYKRQVQAAFARGAVSAVVSRARVATLPDAVLALPLLIAEDPLAALQSLAAHVRRRWGKRVVAITGSAGKDVYKRQLARTTGVDVASALLEMLRSRLK